ncbi:MAG: hypothetical protein ACYC91_09735 [Solirubrobacteraceae bacterium]
MRPVAVLLAIAAILLLPAAAAAQSSSSTCQAYNPQLCAVARNAEGASGTLPFTGLDVALLLAGGGALLGAGLLVRRFSRQLG